LLRNRFSFSPGSRGPGPKSFDALSALENWVEKGDAPRKIIATKYVNNAPAEGVERTRPLCSYPRVARYVGSGSIDDAANFECRMPDRHHGKDR
jgi:feruloyl esterase